MDDLLQLLCIFPEGLLRIVCKWKMNNPTKGSQEIYGIYADFSSRLKGHLNGTFILRERASALWRAGVPLT
jgi:hypothetical protein